MNLVELCELAKQHYYQCKKLEKECFEFFPKDTRREDELDALKWDIDHECSHENAIDCGDEDHHDYFCPDCEKGTKV